MHFTWDWLGPASSVATVIALVVTLLYYLYWWPFNLKKPENLTAKHDPNRVTLSWKSVRRASNYNIYRTNLKSGVMDICSCTTHHHADTTLVASEAYQYYVIAEDQGHQSPQSDVVSIEVKGKPFIFPPLSHPMSDENDEANPVPPADASPEAQWAVEDLHRLLAELQKKNNKTVLAILEITASKPDTPIALSNVCEYAGVTRRQGGAGIGALTLLIKRLNKTKWPFTYPPGQGGPYYQLSKEMAERWRQVEAEAKRQESKAG